MALLHSTGTHRCEGRRGRSCTWRPGTGGGRRVLPGKGGITQGPGATFKGLSLPTSGEGPASSGSTGFWLGRPTPSLTPPPCHHIIEPVLTCESRWVLSQEKCLAVSSQLAGLDPPSALRKKPFRRVRGGLQFQRSGDTG